MDISRFKELADDQDENGDSKELYFVIPTIAHYDEDSCPLWPVVFGLMGDDFDFASLVSVVASKRYWIDAGIKIWVDSDIGHQSVRSTDFVFDDITLAEAARKDALYSFFRRGLEAVVGSPT